MQFAPIVPTQYLKELAGLSNFQLCLAHLCTDKKYLGFYKRCWTRGDFIVLDNGTYELHESVSVPKLLSTYTQIGGTDIVVVPDSEKRSNLSMLQAFMDHWASDFKNINGGVRFMAVPHNPEELEGMLGLEEVDIIGLNRALGDYFEGSRPSIIKKHPSQKFHVLGMYKDPFKEVEELSSFKDQVLGIDSSLPYRILKLGKYLDETRPHPPLIDFSENSLTPATLKHCKSELRYFIDWVQGNVSSS